MNPCPCAMRHEENVSSPPRVLAFNPHEDGRKQRKQHRPPRSVHLPNARGELGIQSLLTCKRVHFSEKCLNPQSLKIRSLTRTHLILTPTPRRSCNGHPHLGTPAGTRRIKVPPGFLTKPEPRCLGQPVQDVSI